MLAQGRRFMLAATTLALVLTQVLASPAVAAPEPGPGRALWGGNPGVQAREPSLGRPLDIVRVYSQWTAGPPQVDTARWEPLVTAERRSTLLVSSAFPFDSWRNEARALNGDGNPANDVPEPYCKTRPVVPGTAQPSGKTWFGAIAAGHYDASLRRWLEQLAALAANTPALYVSLHHEADRLSDGGLTAYQKCLGVPAEYRAAWQRVRLVASGAVGTPKPNLLRRAGGKLVLVVVHTGWGYWHTPGSPSRALVNPSTGQPVPGQSADDQSLRTARVTLWTPAAVDYDVLATDVYNFSGAPLGPNPREVAVDDPATTVRETDQWYSLEVLVRPFARWATNFGALPGGSVRPLMIAEYGSVADPTRPDRRAAWLGAACRFLSAPAQARFQGAMYFDTDMWRLNTWTWRKQASGRWSAVGTPTGVDTRSVAAMAGIGRATRFGGTSACPP
jgi:hypothetical protein